MNFDLIIDAESFMAMGRNAPSVKGLFLTGVVRQGEVLYHVPSLLEHLGVSLAGYIPDGGGLRFLRQLQSLHIWFEDDEAFFSTVSELASLSTLTTLEIGWTGSFHSQESYQALYALLPKLPQLQKLSIYSRGQAYFESDVGAFNRCMARLGVEELTLDGVEFEDYPREPLIFPSSLRVLRLHNCDLPAVDLSGTPLLHTFCMVPMLSVRGLESVSALQRLEKVVFGEDVITLGQDQKGCLSPALLSHYRIALPSHWRDLVSFEL